MCHYQQQSLTDPLLRPGLQDITAHVDFTAVAQAADHAHLQVGGFCSQAEFLLAMGLLDKVDIHASPQQQYQQSQQIKQLLMPT